jgi:hypothetical protein
MFTPMQPTIGWEILLGNLYYTARKYKTEINVELDKLWGWQRMQLV